MPTIGRTCATWDQELYARPLGRIKIGDGSSATLPRWIRLEEEGHLGSGYMVEWQLV